MAGLAAPAGASVLASSADATNLRPSDTRSARAKYHPSGAPRRIASSGSGAPRAQFSAAQRYASLAAALGADVEFHLKDLEVYSAPQPPAGYSIRMEVQAVSRFAIGEVLTRHSGHHPRVKAVDHPVEICLRRDAGRNQTVIVDKQVVYTSIHSTAERTPGTFV